MKKLFFASIVMLAALIACQNENSNDEFVSAPAGKERIEKTAARASQPEMTVEEKEMLIEALQVKDGNMKDETYVSNGRIQLICHTPWNSYTGDACFDTPLGNFNVHWQPLYSSGNGDIGMPVDPKFNPIIFTGSFVPKCNC